ncbi:MAG: hypothetical protein IMY71_14410 [Bacteroidetes bacterium]|nr:hypothetical protein [Bacteroidota bacterium]
MERYIEQLIEDIRHSATRVQPPGELWEDVDMDNPNEVKDISFVEQYINGEPQQLSLIIGIGKEQLPPPNQLRDTQVTLLLNEMVQLLRKFHFVPDFPEKAPDNLRYKVLRDHWDDEHVLVGAGEVHIEFCDYDETQCPFPGYCTVCKEIREESKDTRGKTDIETDIDDLLPTPEEIKKEERLNRKMRIKDAFQRDTDNEQFIPGIYNYCDRWCERCPFTTRCRVAEIEKEITPDQSSSDIQSPEFWETLTDIFKVTREMVEKDAARLGIDLDTEDNDEPDIVGKKADEHPLSKLAIEYARYAGQLLQKNIEYFSNYAKNRENSEVLKTIANDLEIIQWDHMLIGAKLHRALTGLYEQELPEIIQEDMNGSANVALISIDRSISSWSNLLKNNPGMEDLYLKILNQLSRIQKQTKDIFPDAINFYRPGFDDN